MGNAIHKLMNFPIDKQFSLRVFQKTLFNEAQFEWKNEQSHKKFIQYSKHGVKKRKV